MSFYSSYNLRLCNFIIAVADRQRSFEKRRDALVQCDDFVSSSLLFHQLLDLHDNGYTTPEETQLYLLQNGIKAEIDTIKNLFSDWGSDSAHLTQISFKNMLNLGRSGGDSNDDDKKIQHIKSEEQENDQIYQTKQSQIILKKLLAEMFYAALTLSTVLYEHRLELAENNVQSGQANTYCKIFFQEPIETDAIIDYPLIKDFFNTHLKVLSKQQFAALQCAIFKNQFKEQDAITCNDLAKFCAFKGAALSTQGDESNKSYSPHCVTPQRLMLAQSANAKDSRGEQENIASIKTGATEWRFSSNTETAQSFVQSRLYEDSPTLHRQGNGSEYVFKNALYQNNIQAVKSFKTLPSSNKTIHPSIISSHAKIRAPLYTAVVCDQQEQITVLLHAFEEYANHETVLCELRNRFANALTSDSEGEYHSLVKYSLRALHLQRSNGSSTGVKFSNSASHFSSRKSSVANIASEYSSSKKNLSRISEDYKTPSPKKAVVAENAPDSNKTKQTSSLEALFQAYEKVNCVGFIGVEELLELLGDLKLFPSQREVRQLMRLHDLDEDQHLNRTEFFSLLVPQNEKILPQDVAENALPQLTKHSDMTIMRALSTPELRLLARDILITHLDKEKDFEDFKQALAHTPHYDLYHLYALINRQKTGTITLREFNEFLQQNDFRAPLDITMALFRRFDRNFDGKIALSEWVLELKVN